MINTTNNELADGKWFQITLLLPNVQHLGNKGLYRNTKTVAQTEVPGSHLKMS